MSLWNLSYIKGDELLSKLRSGFWTEDPIVNQLVVLYDKNISSLDRGKAIFYLL